jgi:hypothetical protein
VFVVLNELSDSSATVYTNSRAGGLGVRCGRRRLPHSSFWTVPAGSILLVDNYVCQATA